ncbi:hypothetical protein DRQ50_14250, partial [bacterium]
MSRRMFLGRWSAYIQSLALGAVLSVAVSAPVSGALVVKSSGPAGVHFSMAGLQPVWTEWTGADGVVRQRLEIAGFSPIAAGGGPRLPQRGTWVLVPAGSRPELVIRSEKWQAGHDHLLAYAPLTVTRLDGNGGGKLVELSLPPEQALPQGYVMGDGVAASRARAWQARGGSAVELGEVTTWRGRRVVQVRIVPVRHDAHGRVSEVLESGNWEIRFVADRKAAPPSGRPRLDTRGDTRFAGVF